MPFCLVGRTSVSEEPTGSVAVSGIFFLLLFVRYLCFCNCLILGIVFFILIEEIPLCFNSRNKTDSLLCQKHNSSILLVSYDNMFWSFFRPSTGYMGCGIL